MSDFNMQGGSFMGETTPGKENQVMPFFYRAQRYQPVIPGVRDEPTSIGVDMVEIRQAGEKDTQKEEVNDLHKRRWPQQWAAFQAGRAQVADGTPIEHLFPAQPEVAAELKRFNFHTVEALAGAPDSAGAIVPFLTDRKKQAALYLAKNSKAKGYDELRTQNAALMERLAALEAQMAEPEKRGPGRPRKLETLEN